MGLPPNGLGGVTDPKKHAPPPRVTLSNVVVLR